MSSTPGVTSRNAGKKPAQALVAPQHSCRSAATNASGSVLRDSLSYRGNGQLLEGELEALCTAASLGTVTLSSDFRIQACRLVLRQNDGHKAASMKLP